MVGDPREGYMAALRRGEWPGACRLIARTLPSEAPGSAFLNVPQMNQTTSRRSITGLLAAATLAVAALAGCRGAARDPAPNVAPAPATAAPAATAAARQYTGDDVQFVQHMMAHHAQARVMTALVATRTTRDDLRMLAGRIDVSQDDELTMMRRWLERRGEAVPAPDAHREHADHQMMPGMLTRAELERLAAASGAEFDRLFLEYMIRHHEGALVMVRELFASSGGGQEPELFSLASDIDADQRAEIARMRRVLESLGGS